MEQIISAEKNFGNVIIRISHPSKQIPPIDPYETKDRRPFNFWDRVAEIWNSKYESDMRMQRLQRGESGLCNADESIQFRPSNSNIIIFRDGRLSISKLRRVAGCISKSLKEITGRNGWKVELKFKTTYYGEGEDSP